MSTGDAYVKRDVWVDVVKRLPQGAVSRAWGWLARCQHPKPGVALLKKVFVKQTGINMDEAAQPIHSYPTLEDLFVRSLKPGLRPIDNDASSVVSPVDGTVGACGLVTQGMLFQIKGRAYRLSELLRDDLAAKKFEGGAYATFYLSPKDYHRIHAPLAGQVHTATLVPGGLLPVFPEALHKVDGLFARNERIITYLETPHAGRIAVVKVGATLVGRISLAYDPSVWSNQKNQNMRVLNYNPPHTLEKGGLLGAFELGSTVVLVAEKGCLTLEHLHENLAVRMGQAIGSVKAAL
jgi:phosphatidylserine decarboxylase